MKKYNLEFNFYELLDLKGQLRAGILYYGILLKRQNQPEYKKEMIKADIKKYAFLYKKVYEKIEKI